MNDPHDMGNRPVAPSVSPLVRQAARNLHTLEWLSQNAPWHSDPFFRQDFWYTRRMMARTLDEAAAWLPALAFAVSRERNAYVLPEFAWWSFPETLRPEALPWRNALIRSWEQQRVTTPLGKTLRLAALVRLDRRTERLPEWIREARQALDMKPQNRRLRLAALVGWRPRPGDLPAHGDSREAVLQWGQFWEELLRNYSSESDALIAAVALLHLAEAGWLPAGLSPERLREEVRRRVQQCETTDQDWLLFQMALASVPADSPSPEQQDITGWLELTRKNVDWKKRAAVWGMLAAWQREGVLESSGRERLPGRGRLPEPPLLLPDLARTLEWERNDDVLLAVAGYVPQAAEVSAHPEAARAVVARWEALSRSSYWQIHSAAWVARWNLLRGGVLTADEQARFAADYVDAVRSEQHLRVLLALTRMSPRGPFPLREWSCRLAGRNDRRRLAAGLAIHRWLVGEIEDSREKIENRGIENRGIKNREQENGNAISYSLSSISCSLSSIRRQVRQALRRAGQEVTGTVAPFVNLPHDVLPDFRRLHEIETALAAGQMPPPDAGMENQLAPRTVPARLPETQPRMNPPGITDRTTGRTTGSEPPARHPFPEVIRHE
jgi:hypothetical protein